MNDIMKLLNILDTDIDILSVSLSGTTKTVVLEKRLAVHECPDCGMRMYSRGVKTRTASHPILQDGYTILLKVRQRRWQCSNPQCKRNISDHFSFLAKSRRLTNATDLMVVNAFKDYSRTAADVARQFSISDHQALDIFDRYVQLRRLPLPEILCVDEVYLDMDPYCKYVLVLQDFKTGETVDLVKSRRKSQTEDYFLGIPESERNSVKYVISDMYNPYINYCNVYFKNAVPIVDSFHVTQWLIRKLDNYLRQLLKKYKARDLERFYSVPEEKRKQINVPLSDEVYLLQNHRWVLLRNQKNIDYSAEPKKNFHYGRVLSTQALEELFFALDPDLRALRDLKEDFVAFNSKHFDDPEEAAKELDLLIEKYEDCGYSIFNDFAITLKKHRSPIINSFTYASRIKESGEFYESRLSNGPMESLNRKAKDLKRNGRGYSNFDHLRNRFLFSTRLNPPLNGRK